MKERGTVISSPHSDAAGWSAALLDTFGTTSFDFADHALRQVIAVATRTDPEATERATNAALAFIGAVSPKDELEASLALQMLAVQGLSMDCMNRAKNTDTMEMRQAHMADATKLSRTFAAQIDALAKLRGGGKQQVEVRHVYVDARGSQNAFIAGAPGGGVQSLPQPQPPETLAGLALAGVSPVRSEDAQRQPLRLASHQGEEALPDARRSKPRRTARAG